MNLEIIKKLTTSPKNNLPILFIHGAYHGAWCWEYYQDFFAQNGYSSFALSLRGHGKSDGYEDVETATFAEYLSDVEFAIKKISEETGQMPIVVGHSLGGALARKVAEKVSIPAIVMMATPARNVFLSAMVMLLKKYPIKTIKFVLTGSQAHLYSDPEVLNFLFFNQNKDESKGREYLEKILIQKESKGIAIEVMNLKFKDSKNILALVLGGENDVSFKKKHFEQLANLYNSKPIILKDLPHDMMLEVGWELSAKTVLDWLKNNNL